MIFASLFRWWPRALSTVLALALAPLASLAQADGASRWAFSTLSSATPGDIIATPTIGPDGTVYIGVEVGLSTNAVNAGRLFAIKSDGTLKWTFNAPDWIDSAPAVTTTGIIYTGCWDGNLYALNSDGTKRWSYKTAGFIASSPAIGSDGTIYIGSGDGNLYAINPDGSLKWTFATLDWVDSSPAIGPDGTIYVGSWDKHVYAVGPDGTEKWNYPTEAAVTSSPAIAADGTIYIGGHDNQLYAFNPNGTLKWNFDAGDVLEASPVMGADGTIYIGSLSGRFFAVNPDGTAKWQYPRATATALKSIRSTAAVRGDGSILFGSSNNALYALNSDGTILWTSALGDWADSSPVIGNDGSIYIGCTDKKLYAFTGKVDQMITDWAQFHRDPMHQGRQVFGSVTGTAGRLINLSARAVAGTGADTLISGFVVGGSGQRTMLVRGLGPALASLGVMGVLANPQLTAYTGATVIATNNDWGTLPNLAQVTTTSATVGAFPLATNSLDAVLLTDLASGAYTAHVTGASGATGVALMELYDAGGTGSARLVNLSARSTVGTGGNVLIAGFVIAQNTRTVLIRALGPALTSLGVTGVLADPRIRVYRDSVIIAENNDWESSSNRATLAAKSNLIGAYGLMAGSKDAVLMATLPPGAYTVIVSGSADTTGVGLVEVYEVP